MTILAHKQQLTFINHGTWIEAKGKPGTASYVPAHYEGGGGNSVAVPPRSNIQTVPDWVRGTNTFKHAAAAGLVVEVGVITPQPLAESELPQAKPASRSMKEVVTGLSGNGKTK